MALGAQVAVTASPAVAIANSAEIAGGFAMITNAGANEVYLGGADVTKTTGYRLAAGASLPNVIPLDGDESIYAICDTAETTTVHVLVT